MTTKLMTESPQYVAPDSKRVLVTYPDDTNRETTIGELRKFFADKGESEAWQGNFFYELTTKFLAFGAFAKYEVMLD